MTQDNTQDGQPLPGDARALLEGRVVSWNELVADKQAFHSNRITANVVDYNLMHGMHADIYHGRIPAYARPRFLGDYKEIPLGPDDLFLKATDILDAAERLNDKSVKATGGYRNTLPKHFDDIVRALLKCSDYSPSVENGKLVQVNGPLDKVKPGPDGRIVKKTKKFSL